MQQPLSVTGRLYLIDTLREYRALSACWHVRRWTLADFLKRTASYKSKRVPMQ